MACFLVPVTEAIVTTIATKIIEKREKEPESVSLSTGGESAETAVKIPFSRKLKWLNGLLWGGSALLAFEHVWHGEVVPWFPFLTAAADPADAAEMLHEMATAGVAMAAFVTVVWLVLLGVSRLIEKRADKETSSPAPSEG
ncbi:MAG: hypothetical protein J5938_05260 [Clostridia bacterium]|nr:hypothetical protein [Clostridia bacterium]